MSWVSVLSARVRGLFGHERLDRELDDELRFHLDMQTEDNLRAGMSPAEARYAAMRSFGRVDPVKERYREESSVLLVETIAQDVRYSLRTLRRNPAFAAASAATLALAIGANTVMFSVLDAVVLRPLPYPSPEQLAMLWTENPGESVRQGRSAFWNFEQWQSQSRSFAELAAFDGVSSTLKSADRAERISVVRVSPSFFSLLGVKPILGRVFTAEEATQRQQWVVISHRLWQSRFGSRDAIGATIDIDGRPLRILGVLAPGFSVPKIDADVWEPHTLFPDWEARRAVRGVDSWFVIGRLRPGVTIKQAQTEMSTIAARLDEHLPPADRNRGIRVEPLSETALGSRPRLALWLLTAAVCCVVLIAAANVASLSLARSVGRTGEMALRTALGAGPVRIARQLLVESLTLAVISGVLGSMIAWGGIQLIRASQPSGLARLNEVNLDLRVLGWALGVSIVSGLLIGSAPVLTGWRRNLRPSAGGGGRSVSSGAGTRRMRRALVVVEFALAIVLLFGAGLLIRSWWNVENTDPGFRTDRILSIQVHTPAGMPAAQRAGYFEQILEQVQSLPGVESAGLASDLFITMSPERTLTVEGAVRNYSERLQFRRDEVSVRLLQTIGAKLVKGRFFSDADGPGSARVAIVNEALVRRFWPSGDPVGRRFQFGPGRAGNPWFTVAGVVADMRRQGLESEPIPQIFEPLAQNPPGGGSLLVRTSMINPLHLASAVEAAVRRVDKHAPIFGATTLEQRLDAYLLPRRFQTFLIAGFSGVALLLAALGIYGVIQYSIAARTQEIGVRMAVGAQAGQILRMVLAEGLRLSLTGLALGLAGALWASQLARNLLFGVSATDPATLIAVSLILTAVAIAACYLPARRATRIDPVTALRNS